MPVEGLKRRFETTPEIRFSDTGYTQDDQDMVGRHERKKGARVKE